MKGQRDVATASGPRVSVVIPTFNRAALLPQAIDSVLGQTFADLELIVADDGSDDHTPDVLAPYGERVRLVRLEHSGNPGRVRNAALAHARGELVAFLDSDDSWLPRKLQRQVDVLDGDAAVGLVCTNARIIDACGEDTGRVYFRSEQGASGNVVGRLLVDNFVITSTVLARRVLVERAGGFAEEQLLRSVEDYALWLRIALLTQVIYLKEPLAHYRDHAASHRAEISLAAHLRARTYALERLAATRDGREHLPLEELRRSAGACLLALAEAEQAELGTRAALGSWARAARRHPRSVANVLLRYGRNRLLATRMQDRR